MNLRGLKSVLQQPNPHEAYPTVQFQSSFPVSASLSSLPSHPFFACSMLLSFPLRAPLPAHIRLTPAASSTKNTVARQLHCPTAAIGSCSKAFHILAFLVSTSMMEPQNAATLTSLIKIWARLRSVMWIVVDVAAEELVPAMGIYAALFRFHLTPRANGDISLRRPASAPSGEPNLVFPR